MRTLVGARPRVSGAKVVPKRFSQFGRQTVRLHTLDRRRYKVSCFLNGLGLRGRVRDELRFADVGCEHGL